MRMILVHGISQEGKSDKKIFDEWMAALRPQFGAGIPHPLDRLSRIDAAFYGDLLHRRSSEHIKDQAIALRVDAEPDSFDEFATDAMRDMAKKMGVSEEAIQAELANVVVPHGAGIHKKWLKAIARAIEKVSPLKGSLALRVLRQAHAYIRNQSVHDDVNDLVRPLFEDDEEAIVVSHSLGTIVAYSLLREFERKGRPRNVPLLLTLGSPLGIDTVRKGFDEPRTLPNGVLAWVNASDPEDFVALQPALTEKTFGPGIENWPDFENGRENPHGIKGYLSDPRVAQRIAKAIAA